MTGALGKLGPVWSSALVDAGASVLGLDLDGVAPPGAWTDLVARVGAGRVRLARADVLDRARLEAALADCRGAFGVPHILVNNAGVDQPPVRTEHAYRFEQAPRELSQRIIDVNVLGTLLATQVFGGAMVAEGRGSVVNIGSIYGSVSPDQRVYEHLGGDPPFLKPAAYGASKAAVVSLTRYLATLWGARGVRVNALSPGGIAGGQDPIFIERFTSRVPLGRMGTAEDLGGPLVFLASDASSYVTGAEIVVDGGFTAW